MFNREILQDVLADYKKDFDKFEWKNEAYKWRAVKCFQDHWDINADDFAGMLTKSMEKASNLLTSMNNYAAAIIKGFARQCPEETRAMFLALFNEQRDVVDRILAFKASADELIKRVGKPEDHHYQTENAITTYLWLRFPNKYYIYKYGILQDVEKILQCDVHFKQGAYAENLRAFFPLYDEINSELKADQELRQILNQHLTDNCYPDPELKTLTMDVGFYINRFYSEKGKKSEWAHPDYDPEISVEDWRSLLSDRSVFNANALAIMKRMKDNGGEGTCSGLAEKYGETKNFYLTGSVSLAKRVAEKTGCDVLEDEDEKERWWPILYIGREASKDEKGSFMWRIREELSTALDEMDLSEIPLYASKNPDAKELRYWWLTCNPKIWTFSDAPVGMVESYSLYNDNGNKRRVFQNYLDAKEGDIVIGYESSPSRQIVAIAKVSAEQDGQQIYFEKVEGLPAPVSLDAIKSYPELENMEYLQNPQGSFFKLTKDEYCLHPYKLTGLYSL